MSGFHPCREDRSIFCDKADVSGDSRSERGIENISWSFYIRMHIVFEFSEAERRESCSEPVGSVPKGNMKFRTEAKHDPPAPQKETKKGNDGNRVCPNCTAFFWFVLLPHTIVDLRSALDSIHLR